MLCFVRTWETVLKEGERLIVGEFGDELRVQTVGSFMWIFLKVKHGSEFHGKPTKCRLQVSTPRVSGIEPGNLHF